MMCYTYSIITLKNATSYSLENTLNKYAKWMVEKWPLIFNCDLRNRECICLFWVLLCQNINIKYISSNNTQCKHIIYYYTMSFKNYYIYKIFYNNWHWLNPITRSSVIQCYILFKASWNVILFTYLPHWIYTSEPKTINTNQVFYRLFI